MKGSKLQDEKILHRGVIESIDMNGGRVSVRTDSASDCSSCAASKLCNHVSKDVTLITIDNVDASQFEVGDKVRVEVTEIMHRKAIMIAVVVPCLILMLSMVVVYMLTFSELISALSGLVLLLVFYALLYVCRNRIARDFMLKIEKI